MDNASNAAAESVIRAVSPGVGPAPKKGGLIVSARNTAIEIFGQLLTTKFWTGLGILVAKTIVETAVETLLVSFGESLIYYGKKKSKSTDVDEVKTYFKSNQPGYASGGTPAAAAFSRTFNPSTYNDFGRSAPPPVPSSDGGFPGLSPTFR